MPVKDEDRKVVEELFKAMQAGPGGEEAMMALFHEDAVFTEPFSGQPQTHNGIAEIRASFQEMWNAPGPELKLVLDRVDLEGDHVRAEWTCTSDAFPTPMRGYDLFSLKGTRISRLEVVVTEMPPMGPPEA